MEQINQPAPNVENQSQPAEVVQSSGSDNRPSSNWLKFEEVKAAVAHANIDLWDTTADKVQDVVFELFGHRGSGATILKHIATLRKDVVPKISDEVTPVPMPKELQTALHSSHVALWDMAMNVARVTYLHKVEKQSNELANAKRNEEALTRERDTAAEKADLLSNIMEEERGKFTAQLAAVDRAVHALNEQMQTEDKKRNELIQAHKKELDDAMKMLEASNNENTRIKEQAELQIKTAHYEADVIVKPLKEMIKDAGLRESDLRIQLHEANIRAEAAMKRADEYAKQFADLLSNTRPPVQN